MMLKSQTVEYPIQQCQRPSSLKQLLGGLTASQLVDQLLFAMIKVERMENHFSTARKRGFTVSFIAHKMPSGREQK